MFQNKEAKRKTKEWDIGKWEDIAKALDERGYDVYQIGSIEEPLAPFLKDGRSRNSLEFAKQIWDLNCVISIDNAAVHVAKLLNQTIIVLFGKSSDPKIVSYGLHKNVVSSFGGSCWASIDKGLWKEASCATHCTTESGCVRCMQELNVGDVLSVFDAVAP